MRGRSLSGFSLLLAGLAVALQAGETDQEAAAIPGVHLNQIQVVGTHNSYHLEPSAQAEAWRNGPFVQRVAPALARLAAGYRHVSLTEQLARLGLRQLEIDIYPGAEAEIYPVLHHPVFDEASNVPDLRTALREVRDWSRANPRHVPVLVQIELKTRRVLPGVPEEVDDPGLRERLAALPAPRSWDAAQLRGLEAVIRSVFARDELLTPGDVRGGEPTLREAVLGRGWPLLDEVRGRIMFALDNESEVRERYLEVTNGNRLLFVSVPPEHPEAAWMKVNDPVKDFARIQHLVGRGFLVRTRADEELREARANDGMRRERALASGAHFISTDFPEADGRYSSYRVSLPGGAVMRRNPVAVTVESGR